MKLLSRSEEYVLLAVWKLQEAAYSLPIRKQLSDITGYAWSLGSIYTPLDRLDRKGFLTSYLTDSTPERGGRHKRVYRLTKKGRQALLSIHAVQQAMWHGVTRLALQTLDGV
jgi:DNA-binding PadR family transcriptional regulator